jgi:hypothetical protein
LKKLLSIGVVCLILCASAFAAEANQTGFSALKGVEAQPLTSAEMQSISGELNAYDIAAALFDAAAKLDRFPRLQAATEALANFYRTNAEAINAVYMKLGIFTECQSCGL